MSLSRVKLPQIDSQKPTSVGVRGFALTQEACRELLQSIPQVEHIHHRGAPGRMCL